MIEDAFVISNHKSILNHIAFLFRRPMNFNPPAMQQANCTVNCTVA